MVVDLAVEDQPQFDRATMHWLVPGFREIDDRKPAKTKPAATVVKDQFAGVVGSAMLHLVAHARDQRESTAPSLAPYSQTPQMPHIYKLSFQLSFRGGPETRQHAVSDSLISP